MNRRTNIHPLSVPYEQLERRHSVGLFSRQFFVGLIPLSILMFLAAQMTHFFFDPNERFDRMDFNLSASVNDGLNITGYSRVIVPNEVHLIRFDEPEIDFISFIAIKSILANHVPDNIIIYCNFDTLKGEYWEKLREESPTILLRKIEKPHSIYNVDLKPNEILNLAKAKILMETGGIYLDNDVFVIRSLNFFRRFEMSLSWPINESINTHVLIAHRDARLLKKWFDIYLHNEKLPPIEEHLTTQVIEHLPDLVHRESSFFGSRDLGDFLYEQSVEGATWRKFYTLPLRTNLQPGNMKNFNEESVKTLDSTFGSMVRLLLYGDMKLMV